MSTDVRTDRDLHLALLTALARDVAIVVALAVYVIDKL
jgi:hypothetical protein